MTVAESDHPAMKEATDVPVLTRPIFQLRFRPASASAVHVPEARMFTEKLPEEKSFGGDPGLMIPPQEERHRSRAKPAQGWKRSSITVSLEQAAGGSIIHETLRRRTNRETVLANPEDSSS
jgi:hypothetical protein